MQRGYNYDPEQFRRVLAVLEHHMGLFGYRSFFVPTIENADLFLIKAGDQIIKQLFTFERHNQQLALRPEFTAAAAYYYAQRYSDETPVVRWRFSGSVFEDAPEGARERLSAGAELIGLSGPAADAEIIALAAQGLIALGLFDWRLTIGHTRIIRQVLSQYAFDSRTERFLLHHLPILRGTQANWEFLAARLDAFLDQADQSAPPPSLLPHTAATDEPAQPPENSSGRTPEDVARRLRQKQQRRARRDDILNAFHELERWANLNDDDPEAIFNAMTTLAGSNPQAQTTLTEWRQTMDLVYAYKISFKQIQLQPALARSWDYYTGIVFELTTGDGMHLGGGGRYDELVQLIGRPQPAPAVGFAYYLDAILSRFPLHSDNAVNGVMLTFPAEQALLAVEWAQVFRQHGMSITLMPEITKQLANDLPQLHISTDGSLDWQGRAYRLEQVSELVSALNR